MLLPIDDGPMRSPKALPSQLQGIPLWTQRALRAGVNPERLRRNDLAAPYRGIRVDADDDAAVLADDLDRDAVDYWTRLRALATARARAYSQRMPVNGCFSRVTAARLHRLYLPERLATDMTLDVATTDQRRRPRAAGVRSHVLRAGTYRTLQVQGMPVLTPIDTWRTLSTVLEVDELVAVGDQLVERVRPRATVEHLAEAVSRHGRGHGSRQLREALSHVRPRTDSPKETSLRLIITSAGLPEPQVNALVTDARGQRIRLGDLVYLEYRILIEYDGEQHRTDDVQYGKDADALDAAMAAGWRVIRVRKHHLPDPDAIAGRVRGALLERGWRP